MWGGARASLWWNVTGFEGADEIYSEDIELDPDTLKSHLQDLAKQHLVRGDRNKPALWESQPESRSSEAELRVRSRPALRGHHDRARRMSGRERDEAVRFSSPTVTVPAVGSSAG